MIDYNQQIKELTNLIYSHQPNLSKRVQEYLGYEISRVKKQRNGKKITLYKTKNKFILNLPSHLINKCWKVFKALKEGLAYDSFLFETLNEVLKYAKLFVEKNKSDDSRIKVDNFQLVFFKDRKDKDGIVKCLQSVANKLKKEFHFLIYGKIFLQQTGHAGALYSFTTDTVKLEYKAHNNHIEDYLIHEFGHRYWYRFMSDRERMDYIRGVETNKVIINVNDRRRLFQQFDVWVDFFVKRFNRDLNNQTFINQVKFNLKHLPRELKSKLMFWLKYKEFDDVYKAIEKISSWYDEDSRELTQGAKNYVIQGEGDIVLKTKNKYHMKILSPTKYGEKSAIESFAETFLWYVTDRKLDDELLNIFLKAIKK